jgi:5-methylcytosine-specific restriction enzyme subunit McrC
MLLYPKHLFDVKEDLKLGVNENLVELKMRSLDLNFDGSYEKFIEEMGRRLKKEINEYY